MSLSKKTRFEVFKRDSFTCQYCGRKAPDVVLECDHIEPRSKGGTDDLLNLVTSCRSCNRGKSDRRLDDDTVVQKRRRQLEELQERRQQIEMMVEWQRSLADLENTETEQVGAFLSDMLDGHFGLSRHGSQKVSQLLDDFSLQEVLEACRISVNQYARFDESGRPTPESVETIIDKLGGICYNRRRWNKDPEQETLDKGFWAFLREYRSECSHHPEKWELRKWWTGIVVPMVRDAGLIESAESIGKQLAHMAKLEFYDGGHSSYANALLVVLDNVIAEDFVD